MNRAMSCLALVAACGGSPPPPTAPPGAGSKSYAITVNEAAKGVATVVVAMPAGWTERYDDKRGSPALLHGADGMASLIDVIDLPRERMVELSFKDDTDVKQTAQPDGRLWVTGTSSGGQAHAAMLIAADAKHTAMCDIRRNKTDAVFDEAVKICRSLSLASWAPGKEPEEPPTVVPPPPHADPIQPRPTSKP